MAKTYLEAEEILKLEGAANNLRDKLLIRVLFRGGCRISEVLSLEVNHVDFKKGTVTIRHLKARTRLTCPECGARLAKSHTFCPKCGAKVSSAVAKEQEHHRMRTLPLDSDTLKLLRRYVRHGGPVNRGGRLTFPGFCGLIEQSRRR